MFIFKFNTISIFYKLANIAQNCLDWTYFFQEFRMVFDYCSLSFITSYKIKNHLLLNNTNLNMKHKFDQKKIKLYQMSNLNFDKRFNIFYKFRFHPDYLKNNIDRQKISKKENKIWFKKSQKKKKLFAIKKNNNVIGLIIYNLNNHFYSITILEKYRDKGIGTYALLKFIEILKRKRLPLATLVKKNNKNSVHIHKKISKLFRSKNKLFYYFKII